MTKSEIARYLKMVTNKDDIIRIYKICNDSSIVRYDDTNGIKCWGVSCDDCPFHPYRIKDFVDENRAEIIKYYFKRIEQDKEFEQLFSDL